MSENTARQH